MKHMISAITWTFIKQQATSLSDSWEYSSVPVCPGSPAVRWANPGGPARRTGQTALVQTHFSLAIDYE